MLEPGLHNERELLLLISQADENAFAKLFDYYRNRIYGIALKLTHSTTIAEEIVQDVFLKIWLRRDTLNEIDNFSAYLFTIARNETYKILKQIAKSFKIVALDENNRYLAHDNAQNYITDKEYGNLLQKAIDRLPGQQKQVYYLMKEGDLKRDEVAHHLNIQPETVKYHLAQAMKNIRAFCMLHFGILSGFVIVLFRFIRNN
ncbi:RNA polymerase sigma-70 factor [Ginsengibacter hankyongi]|uniref:RNA polymerase sigma factor n=1 Tax=Ginsengibacter hankyongi TaxID=2607284 RepID=A0A5J5IFK5_9BACT|nr:RNA polymerase sigma-70 factor [Ginsengibacter hankyongi]KAA9038662.1 RNA polymerase sigma-70 factor [Ginsengibacter hankyongi]